MKRHLLLFALSFLFLIIWLGETLLRDWSGLEWLNYFHISMFIIPSIFLFWLILIDNRTNLKRQKVKYALYPILIIAYTLFCLILILSLEQTGYRPAAGIYLYPIVLFVFGAITFCMNLIISKIEGVKLGFKEKMVLFFSSIFIPISSDLVTTLVFTQTYLFPSTSYDLPSVLLHFLGNDGQTGSGIFNSILHWLKSGALIMSIAFYEGAFILYLKKDKPLSLVNKTI